MADFSVSTKITAQNRTAAAVGAAARGLRGRLTPALRGAAKAAHATTRALASSAKRIALLGVAAAGAAAFGIAKLVQSHVEALDSLGEFSRRIGFGVEALQEWRHVAQRAGVETETLDEGLSFFTKAAGQAAAGTGKLAGFLKKTSPALLAAIKGSTTAGERFDLMVEAMRSVKDPAKRAALAAAAFGGAGLKLGSIAESSAEQIAAWRAEAIAFGIASEKDVAQAEAFADAQDSLKASIRGATVAIGSELLPALKPVIEQFTEWIRQNRALIAQKVRDVVMGIVEGIRDLVAWLKEVDWSAVIEEIKTFAKRAGELIDKLGGLKNTLIILGSVMLGAQVLGAFTKFGPAAALALNPLSLKIALIAAALAALGFTVHEVAAGLGSAAGGSKAAAAHGVAQKEARLEDQGDLLGLGRERGGNIRIPSLEGGSMPVGPRAGRSEEERLADVRRGLGERPLVSPVSSAELLGLIPTGRVEVDVKVAAPAGTTVTTTSSGQGLDVSTTKDTGRRSTVGARR